jgi:hypothetical protein
LSMGRKGIRVKKENGDEESFKVEEGNNRGE